MPEPTGDPPTNPEKAAITVDQPGSAAVVPAGNGKPSSHLTFKPPGFLVPVPPDDGADEDDDGAEEPIPGLNVNVPPPPTPVEPIEETDEAPLAASPTVTHETATPLYNDLAGPRDPAPKEIDMINKNPGSPVPQKTGEKSWSRSSVAAVFGGLTIALALIVAVGMHKPTKDDALAKVAAPEVHATEPVEAIADATPVVLPPHPPEIPTPPAEVVPIPPPAVEVARGPDPASANPTTGYEDDEPTTVAIVATSPAAPAVAVAKPVPPTPPVAAAKPIAAATPLVVKPATTTVAAPVAAPASEIPRSIVVSAMGKNPSCKAAYAWGNLDPADGYPFTVNGTRTVTGPGGTTYVVATWTKIADGPQKYCYKATGITVP